MHAHEETSPLPRGGRIDKAGKMGWTVLDEPGVLSYESKRNLNIDLTYQRSMISQTRVQQIAQAWSWVACGTIIVAERSDRSLWVIDGQTRVVATMRRSDIDELPCLVFASDSLEWEARAFLLVNCVRGNVTPFDRLRAALSAGDVVAKDTVALIESAGYHVSSSDGANTIRCVAMFLSHMKSDRGVMTKLWPLIAELHDGRGIRSRVLAALIYLGKFGTDDISAEPWRSRVLARGFGQINDSIDRVCSLYMRGGSKLFAIGALDIINKGVRGGHRMTLREAVDDENDDA